jgi:hypothetical protein
MSPVTPATEPTEEPPTTPTAVAAEPPAMPPPAFEAALYRDEFAGFELDYPADWTLDDVDPAVKQAERGYYAQLTSWPHAPGEIAEELPPGGSRLDITVQQWDPADDLAAHLEMRKTAWSSSGMTILAEEQWTLAGDHPAVRVLVQGIEGEQAFFLITTTANGRYLVLSGTGDIALLEAIGRTVQVAAQS